MAFRKREKRNLSITLRILVQVTEHTESIKQPSGIHKPRESISYLSVSCNLV